MRVVSVLLVLLVVFACDAWGSEDLKIRTRRSTHQRSRSAKAKAAKLGWIVPGTVNPFKATTAVPELDLSTDLGKCIQAVTWGCMEPAVRRIELSALRYLCLFQHIFFERMPHMMQHTITIFTSNRFSFILSPLFLFHFISRVPICSRESYFSQPCPSHACNIGLFGDLHFFVCLMKS